jgi:hypothetical protein
MQSPAIVAYSLAFVVVGGLGIHVIHELRQRAIERTRDRLQHLAHQGEAVGSLPESDVRSRCQWGTETAETVRRFLAPSIAEDFAGRVADLLIGAEALDAHAGRQRRPDERPLVREQRCVRSMTEGIRWLRLRAHTVGPREMKGRLWWLRR